MRSDSATGLVSVVIPAYGRPEYLEEAVESVAGQTYSPIELVVVDDCSPDPIEPIVEDAETDGLQSVRVVRHEENRGANAARNTGIENAAGEYVAFLDDDDRWRPRKVEAQVRAFEAGGAEVGFVYTGQEKVNEDGTTMSYRVPETRGDVALDLLHGASLCPFSSVMVRRTVIDEVGLLDTRFPSWQDREWYLRISEVCAFEVVDEPLVVRHVDSHGQISDNYEAKRDVSYPLLLEKHRARARRYGAEHERALISTQSRALAQSALTNGYYDDAVRLALRSLRYEPKQAKPLLIVAIALGGDSTVAVARKTKRILERFRGRAAFQRAGDQSKA